LCREVADPNALRDSEVDEFFEALPGLSDRDFGGLDGTLVVHPPCLDEISNAKYQVSVQSQTG